MKSQVSCADEDRNDDWESCRLAYCWWRKAAKFNECAKLKLDFPDVSILTPTLRLLRELERLALIAPQGLSELRRKLIGYRSGDFWVPTGGINKEDMNIPPVNTILLVGFSGSGKSSLINLMYTILAASASGLIPFAQTSSGGNCSNYTTMYMEEHNVVRSMQSGFCVVDSRGFDYGKTREALNEVSSWMSEGIHHNQLCGGGDYRMATDDREMVSYSYSRFAQRRVYCVIVVANVAEIYKALKAGDMGPLKATRQLFCSPALRKSNENPLLILTHGDLLSTEERLDCRLKICECLDISHTQGVYDIVCLTEYGFVAQESDPVSAYALTEALYKALLISDRSHSPKTKLKDWALLLLLWLVRSITACFLLLAHVFSKLGHNVGNRYRNIP